MCDPITIAGVALSAGGLAANTVANNRVQKARKDAMAAERIRQQGLDAEAAALNLGSQDRYQGFQGQQDTRGSELGQYFQEQASPLDTPVTAMPASNSNITVQEEGRQRGEARDRSDKEAGALGQLRGFGDLLGGISRLQARDASKIGQIGGFKQGSSGVLGMEMEGANSAGDKMKFLGDILSGAGRVATGAGLSGATLGFGGAAGAPDVAGSLASGAPGASTFSLPAMARPVGQAALSLPNSFSSLPTFAQQSNLYRFF